MSLVGAICHVRMQQDTVLHKGIDIMAIQVFPSVDVFIQWRMCCLKLGMTYLEITGVLMANNRGGQRSKAFGLLKLFIIKNLEI